MKAIRTYLPSIPRPDNEDRRGSIMLLAAIFMVVIFAITAFSVDLGFVMLTKAHMETAADGAALSAAIELADGLSHGDYELLSSVESSARAAAVEVASYHPAGEIDAAYVSSSQDVRIGNLQWDPATESWVKNWGASPYNLVEVTLRRDQLGSDGSESISGDSAIPLFFAPVIGYQKAQLSVKSTAGFLPGVGFRVKTGSNLNAQILPIALDLETWENLMAGIGEDHFSYDRSTGKTSCGPDGILEVNLYPEGKETLPPGNRGTVDIGKNNNSTADLSRQILYGLNDEDLEPFGGELRWDKGPLYLNGDTGLSAGIKDELEAIKGQPRAIPIFTEVSGPGNNATYTIVKFVGIRILDVKLTGSPSKKHVTIQPAPFVDATVIYGSEIVGTDSIFTSVKLMP